MGPRVGVRGRERLGVGDRVKLTANAGPVLYAANKSEPQSVGRSHVLETKPAFDLWALVCLLHSYPSFKTQFRNYLLGETFPDLPDPGNCFLP